MLHITLTKKALANDPTDPLKRTYYGWSDDDTVEENWRNNRGYYILGERADRQSYVVFSHGGTVVMVAKIQRIVDAEGKPGKRIIEGKLLADTEPMWQTYVGSPTPARAVGVRNPITYVNETEAFGRPCGCGCGEIVFENDFVRGHDQTALHQRVSQIGTIKEFLRWFDDTMAGSKPAAPTRTTVSWSGHIEITVDDGELHVSATREPATVWTVAAEEPLGGCSPGVPAPAA